MCVVAENLNSPQRMIGTCQKDMGASLNLSPLNRFGNNLSIKI